uniref:Tantalus domain-containing protein n=1 Tax=Glossina brevipalpis TaxID=37001 RepID=A0A1A9WGH2_9MUSC
MDRIVLGIANINFQQENSKEIAGRFAINRCQKTSVQMEPFKSLLDKPGQWCINSERTMDNIINKEDFQVVSHEISGATNIDYRVSRRTSALIERRVLPPRASKDDSAFGNNRRSIMKPSKYRQQTIKNFAMLKPNDIKKIYMKKTKLTNFKPSSLETIFEEANDNDIEDVEHARLIGNRKIKRCLSCHNGVDQNKALVNKRRAKIKKTFGGRVSLSRVSLEEFLKKLNESRDKEENGLSACHE